MKIERTLNLKVELVSTYEAIVTLVGPDGSELESSYAYFDGKTTAPLGCVVRGLIQRSEHAHG